MDLCALANQQSARARGLTCRGAAFYLLMALTMCVALEANAQTIADIIVLRSGPVQLMTPSDLANGGGDTGGGTVVQATVPGGTDQLGRQLFLMRYNKGAAWQLRDTLVDLGASIIDYVAEDTLLVFVKPEAVISAATLLGVLVAEYQPGIRISPETFQVISAALPARLRRDHRRALLDTAGDAASATVGGGTARRTPSQTATLGSVQTWTMYTLNHDISDDDATAGTAGRAKPPAPPPKGGPDLYGVSARLVAGLPNIVLLTASQVWPAALAAALGRDSLGDACRPRIIDDGLNSLLTPHIDVFFCAEDFQDGVFWLTSVHFITWVEPILVASAYNAVEGWTLQTGALTTAQYNNPTASLRPYWNASIQGQGIIVGVTDTGIDLSQCYFIDDKYGRPGSLRSMFVGNPPRLYMPYHRKLVQYMIPTGKGTKWFGSEVDGHGTHVVGSIAGSIQDNSTAGGFSNDAATGSAPLARISFFATSYPGSNTFNVPTPVDDKVLSYHYGAGARISSESWGRASALGVAYTSTSRFFDSFAWKNPDFISVVAAGNFGRNGMISVTAPATAKNVIAVGASVNHPKDSSDSEINNIFLFRYKDVKGVIQESAVWPQMGSNTSSWINLLSNKEVPVKMANPEGACSSLVGNYIGSIVLVDLKFLPCSNETSASNAANSGAIAILFIVSDTLFLEGRQMWIPQSTTINFALISRAQGLSMRSVLRNSTNTTNAIMTHQEYPKINLGIDSLAPFSSYGPLWDGRIKPDLVAPGGPEVLSASGYWLQDDATSGTCSKSTVSLQGTSMATPLVSGHLALMRQYFRDGFYPMGVNGHPSSASFEPSGMLLKAAAITGADSLTGGLATSAGKVMGAAPDGYQGWGRMDLSGSLPLPGLTSPNFRIQVADYGTIQDGDYIYLRGIKATGTGPILATLVWHDYPSSGQAVKDLVNDLDFGYQINPKNVTTVYNRTRPDDTNNVERVELRSLKAKDNVVFVVQGRSIRHQLLTGPDAQLPQRWAVVVVGHFTGTLKTVLNPAYTRPQRIQDTRITVGLPNDTCVISSSGSLISANTTSCSTSSAIFSLTEEAGNNTAGYLYTIRDPTLGKCWMVNSNATGTRVFLATCNSTAFGQKFAFFRNTYVDGGGPFYQLVPQPFLGSTGDNRRCLRLAGNSVTLQSSCSDDDVLQTFRIQRPNFVPAPPPAPPAPAPPMPSPQLPVQPWYPYPLLFRTDFYPVQGAPNDYDYDYAGGDRTDDPTTYSNLDIIVSWTWAGSVNQVGIDNFLYFDNKFSVAGAVHGGDNIFYDTMFEEVHWQIGYTPPPTVYNICVVWKSTETPTMKVKLTIFRGTAVGTVTKIFNTTVPSATTIICNGTFPGFVSSYNFTPQAAPAVPPTPPAPWTPTPSQQPFPLLFRTEWTPLQGFTGRENQVLDFDIVVAWKYQGTAYELGYDYQAVGGGVYGGNNEDNKTNYEIAYWPADSTPPPVTFDVCIRWYDKKTPLVQVALTVMRGNSIVSTTVKTWDTTFPRVYVCNNASLGYIGSYTIISNSSRQPPPILAPSPQRPPPSQPPPQPPSSCVTAPAPSSIFGLYFRTQWLGSPDTYNTIFDWDMVVAWSYQGQSFELNPKDRSAGGGVHTGDNMAMANKTNGEVAFWPTGLTGQLPSSTDYHVCVRWYQSAALNVTLTVSIGDRIVKTTARTWASTTFHSKICNPDANGYVGSFTYV